MTRSQSLSEEDRTILDVLTCRVRIAASAQLHEVCGSEVGRRLGRLQKRGLLQRATLAVRRPKLKMPLWIWFPSAPAPQAGAMAWKLQKRWKEWVPRIATIWWATSRAARLMGGVGGRLRQPLQVEHDLGVTAMYLHYRATGRAEHWMGEDRYRREFRPSRQEKIADAIELAPSGEIQRVFEFGGAYSAPRIWAFHQYWFRKQIPYELW